MQWRKTSLREVNVAGQLTSLALTGLALLASCSGTPSLMPRHAPKATPLTPSSLEGSPATLASSSGSPQVKDAAESSQAEPEPATPEVPFAETKCLVGGMPIGSYDYREAAWFRGHISREKLLEKARHMRALFDKMSPRDPYLIQFEVRLADTYARLAYVVDVDQRRLGQDTRLAEIERWAHEEAAAFYHAHATSPLAGTLAEQSYYYFALELEHIGRLEQAEQAFREYDRRFPQSPYAFLARYNVASLSWRRGTEHRTSLQASLDAFERAIAAGRTRFVQESSPRCERLLAARCHAGELSERLGQVPRARLHYKAGLVACGAHSFGTWTNLIRNHLEAITK